MNGEGGDAPSNESEPEAEVEMRVPSGAVKGAAFSASRRTVTHGERMEGWVEAGRLPPDLDYAEEHRSARESVHAVRGQNRRARPGGP